jgi:hypothetical protein
MALIAKFKRQLTEYLSKHADPCGNLIVFENKNKYDLSFVKSYLIWCNYLQKAGHDDSSHNDNILLYGTGKKDENEAIDELKRASEQWTFQINRIEHDDNRYFVHLHRSSAISTVLSFINTLDYVEKDEKETISIELNVGGNDESSITDFRLQTIETSLRNLIIHATKYKYVTDSSIAKHKLVLTTSSNSKMRNEHGKIMIHCGVVLNENKKSLQSAEEFLAKRTNEMHLTAVHKYGLRVKNDKSFLEMVDGLGKSCAFLNMVEVKCSQVVKLKDSTKQAFILYNSARLETLLANFSEKVKEGYYEELPTEINTSLLKDDLEWELIKFVLEYPETMHKASYDIEKGIIGLHLIYNFMYSFMATFSTYYSKIKVLTENRPQLIPALHAKIHLLRAVQKCLNHTFRMFDIHPVSFM